MSGDRAFEVGDRVRRRGAADEGVVVRHATKIDRISGEWTALVYVSWENGQSVCEAPLLEKVP